MTFVQSDAGSYREEDSGNSEPGGVSSGRGITVHMLFPFKKTHLKDPSKMRRRDLCKQLKEFIRKTRKLRPKDLRNLFFQVNDEGTQILLHGKRRVGSVLAALCEKPHQKNPRSPHVYVEIEDATDVRFRGVLAEQQRAHEEDLKALRREMDQAAAEMERICKAQLEELRYDLTFEKGQVAGLKHHLPQACPLVVIDGNLSSCKTEFMHYVKSRLPDVFVTLREEYLHKDLLRGLYSYTNPKGNTEVRRRFKPSEGVFIHQSHLMTWGEYQMTKKRDVPRIVEHSLFIGEFVFRPNLATKHRLLNYEQLEKLSARFHNSTGETGIPDLFIVMRVNPQKALERIEAQNEKERNSNNQPFEEDVTLEYLQAIEELIETKYIEAIEKWGGHYIELDVDIKEGDTFRTATKEELLQQLREKLRVLRAPRAKELREMFGVKEEEPYQVPTHV